ncbi:MAG TPA: CHASE3 domain-containing protein [Chryseolinea sp.]|nr:CHASE3 domain-containing protein [Chryseolinea sp.]HPM31421.1 CHASE3 domain-containing protein [Chryseolinea sp.]
MKKYYSQITFFFIITVLIAVSFLTYRNLSNYTEEAKWIRHSNRILRTLEMTLSSLTDAETGHRGYQLSRDTVFLLPYHSATITIPPLVSTLDSLVSGDPDQKKKVDSLQGLINYQFLLIARILANANRSSLYMDTYESNLLKLEKDNMDAIRNQIHDIREAENQILINRTRKENDFRNIAPIAILIYTLVAIGGAIVLFYRMIDALRRREQTERELATSNEALKDEVKVREFTQTLLRNVLDNSINGIMAFRSVRNADNEIIDFEWILANVTSLKASNTFEKDIIGKRLLDIMPGNREQGIFDLYKNVVEKGLPQTTEVYYTGEGLDTWFYISAIKLDDGFVVTFSDVTEQKQQIVLVKERELLLKEAEVLANMGSWKWTAKGNQMVWSDGLSRILGNVSEEKRSWDTFIECAHKEDKEMLQIFITNAMNKQEGFRMEYRCIVNDSVRHFYISVTAETEIEKGNILGVVVDITDLKLKEKQLEQINIDLTRSNQDLEQFAYVASHDLQEPLRKIRAFGDLLVTKYAAKVEATGADYIDRMQGAASRMQILIQDLLSFSRVSRSSINNQFLDVNSIIEEVVDDLENQIQREGAIIQVGELLSVKGDKVQLKRLFQNLISNAIKFHKANEKPTIKMNSIPLTMENQAKYFPSAQPDTKYIMFTVEDNGIGFDQQYTDKIFNIFQRLNGRMDYEGTGIGLAICRKIVTNHHGIITAESKEGMGSKFIIILPVD